MHQSEAVLYETCSSCGTEVLASDRTYAFEDNVVCYECGIARGGAYDEVHDRWTRSPDISDLRIETAI